MSTPAASGPTTHSGPWPPGTPCWVDVTASDLARTQEFYGRVLGWTFTASMPEFGGYCNAIAGDGLTAGVSPTWPGAEDKPKTWTVYLATNDITATSTAIAAAGGAEVSAPMQVGPFGSMGVWTDPTGATFGAWQGDQLPGFTVVDVPGAVSWCDLMSTDDMAARSFYADVFGYTYQDIGMGDQRYALFSVPEGERPAGGIGLAQEGGSSTWTVCFQVADVDAAVAVIADAGGVVTEQPYDIEYGRILGATGPDGEAFWLMTPPHAS